MPKKNFAADLRAEKSQEGLRRKTNNRLCPIKLGPRILKIVVFGARRRLLHPHFGLGSNATKQRRSFVFLRSPSGFRFMYNIVHLFIIYKYIFIWYNRILLWKELTMVDLSVCTNHRMGDMYNNRNVRKNLFWSLILSFTSLVFVRIFVYISLL